VNGVPQAEAQITFAPQGAGRSSIALPPSEFLTIARR
jgi:hypothetical protein